MSGFLDIKIVFVNIYKKVKRIKMEVWDLYNREREIIGSQIRGEPLPENGYHLVVHVWIRNQKGEYLISRRSATRAINPLMWECVGGSVLKGESSLDAALRETKEEVGIDINKESGKLIFTKIRDVINGEKFNDIMDVWFFNYDGDVDLRKATTNEVCDVKWMNKEEIKEYFDKKQLVPTLEYFFEKF